MHIYRLQDDYMNIDVLTGRLWQGEYREAPAIFQRGEKLYMLSSFCTGWDPNQGNMLLQTTWKEDGVAWRNLVMPRPTIHNRHMS